MLIFKDKSVNAPRGRFASVLRGLAVAAGLSPMLATGAAAESCHVGDYSGLDEAAHPGRTVSHIRLHFIAEGDLTTFVEVRFRGEDRVWRGETTCVFPEPVGGVWQEIMFCEARCGGAFILQPADGGGALLKTRGGFRVGDDCTDAEALPLVEDHGEVETIYPLDRVDDAACRR